MSDLVLVTGANGFIGRHLVFELLKAGYYVRALDHTFTQVPEDGAERIKADILDHAIIKAAMEGVKTVYHLAAITLLWVPDENLYQAVNVEGTRRILEAAIKADAERFIYCSSYVTTISGSRQKRTITEKDNPEPHVLFGAYARSKRRAEQIVQQASFRIETTIVQPSAPIGPGDYNLTAPTAFIRDLVNGTIPAFIDQVTNFVDVKLLAQAIVKAGTDGKPAEKYLLTGQNRDIRDFLTLLAEITGLDMPTTRVPYSLAAIASFTEEKIICKVIRRPPKAPYAGVRMAGRPFDFDHSKASFEFGLDLTPIEDALIETVLWLKKEGHLTRSMPAFSNIQE